MRIPRELTLSADLGGSSNYLNKRKIILNLSSLRIEVEKGFTSTAIVCELAGPK